jgi:3-hydroxyisobutyrate dehydrogenase
MGTMGAPMCGRLIDAGFAVTVYDVLESKAKGLLEKGALWAGSPRSVAETSDVVVSIVGFPDDVRQVLLGPEGVLVGSKPGNVIVDMTTSKASLAREIYDKAKAKGVASVDAPVSGGRAGAQEGRLSIMIGGDRDVVDALQPVWQVMGKTILYAGGPGSGQHTKMVNQILIAANITGVCEALLYAYKAGLDLPAVLDSVASGAAGSWQLNTHGPRTIQNRFDPGFLVDHFIKDMGIALGEAKRMGLVLPVLALVHQLYMAVQAQGHGKAATNSLELTLSNLCGIDWKNRDL